MPVPKRPTRYRRHDGLTPRDAALRFAVMKAKPPRRDEAAAIELALEFGANVADVVEIWHERAAIRTYEANSSVDDADREALADVRQILEAKSRNAVTRSA